MWQREIRTQCDRLAQHDFGFLQPALPHQGETQVVVRIGMARIARNRLPRRGFRLMRLAVQRQHPRHVGPGKAK